MFCHSVSRYQASPGSATRLLEGGFLLGDPQGVEGIGAGLGTSVTASRMTDAYGASTLAGATRVSTPWYMITLMLKCVTPVICDPLLNQPAPQENL